MKTLKSFINESVYDYLDAITGDVLDYINENIDLDEFDDRDELREKLNDELFVSDVTGNASGSYTYNSWTAEEYVAHNWDLLVEALENFGDKTIPDNAETADVTIRCYLLPQAIEAALDQVWAK